MKCYVKWMYDESNNFIVYSVILPILIICKSLEVFNVTVFI